MYTKSISLANSEPCGGIIHLRSQSINYFPSSFLSKVIPDTASCETLLAAPLGAEHAVQKTSQDQDGQHAAGLHEVGGEQHVLVLHGIVVIAEQQNFFDGHGAAVLSRLGQ